MKSINLLRTCAFFLFVIGLQLVNSQEETSTEYQKFLRPKNVVSTAVGTSVINGDFVDPMFEIYSHIGYKRFLGKYFNLHFSYNKFNLAYKDVFNEGFMSFDLNLGYVLFPDKDFTPYIFVGGGYNAANYFKQTATKAQGGIGIEYLFMENVGFIVFSDYNYVFSDELDGLVAGDADDTYFRIGLGLNFYFGKNSNKKRIKKGEPTVITSFPIDGDK